MNEQKTLISWTAPEFIKYEKSKTWFIVMGIISAALIITAFLMKNYLFVLIIVLATFLVFVQAKKRPRKIDFMISETGVTVDEKEYLYSELKSFWIFEEPELHFLSIITKKTIQPHFVIPLANQKPELVRQALIKFIPERKQEESLSDVFARKIKF